MTENDNSYWQKATKSLLVAGAMVGAAANPEANEVDAQSRKPAATAKAADKGKDAKPPVLTKEERELIALERERIGQCAGLVRSCSLHNTNPNLNNNDSIKLREGAIRMSSTGEPIWVVPYHGHQAILGLLASKAHTKAADNKEDMKTVAKWLKWCCDTRKETGYSPEFEGAMAANTFTMKKETNGAPYSDAVDSEAALFLAVIERFHAASEKLPPAEKKALANIIPAERLEEAAKTALKTLEDLRDPTSGLTYAKSTYQIMFLMDNCEVKLGLEAAERLFTKMGATDEAARAKDMADTIAKELPAFWDAEQKWFKMARGANNVYSPIDKTKTYPDGLAQLFALGAKIDIPDADQKALWETLNKDAKYTGATVDMGPVRWLITANSVGSAEDISKWKKAVLTQKPSAGIYVDVPGLAVDALTNQFGKPLATVAPVKSK